MIEIQLQKHLQAASGLMELNVVMQFEEGIIASLYGKSGAGKTSVLRMLAGLMSAEAGRVVLGDSVWLDTEQGINLRPQERKVGFLFQDYALFPNMNVEENLRFALAKGQDKRIVDELIDLMELGDLRRQKTTQLSGGQQQRVALGRALVQKPDLLLLDEPLSALDTTMRRKLQDYILEVHQNYALTILLVSHDSKEINKLSNLVFEIEAGQIIQSGTPMEILEEQNFVLRGQVIAIEDEWVHIQVGIDKLRVKRKGRFSKVLVGETIQLDANISVN